MGPEKQPTRPADEVRGVFEGALEVIHSALVSYYRLSDEEARGAEEDLLMWFQRLGRRGGTGSPMPAKMLRLSLLSAACQYGRSFQLWKLGGAQSPDADLNQALSREPEEVAIDLDRRFQEKLS